MAYKSLQLKYKNIQSTLTRYKVLNKRSIEALKVIPGDEHDMLLSKRAGILGFFAKNDFKTAEGLLDQWEKLIKERVKAAVEKEFEEKKNSEKQLFLGFENFDTFENILTAVPEDINKMNKAYVDMLARTKKMELAGFNPEEQAEMFSHIPRNFLPLKFKMELQDFLIANAAIKEIATRKLFKGYNAGEIVETGAELFSSVAGTLAQGTSLVFDKEKAEAVSNVLEIMKQIGELTALTTKEGVNIKEGIDEENPVKLMLLQEELLEIMMGLGDMGIDIAGEFIPWLGTLKNGKNMLKNLRESWKRDKLQKATEKLKLKAESTMESTSQLGKALGQASDREGSLSNRAYFDTVVNSIEFTESALTSTVVLAKAGAVLKVVGKTIKLGGVVVVNAIDWKAAAEAVKVLEDAQAGSEKAMQEVFSKHSQYAKMLLAVYAKDGNSFAKKYFVDRGLNESHLSHPTTSFEILYEFGLKRSKETEGPVTFSESLNKKLETAKAIGEFMLTPIKALALKMGLYEELTPEQIIERSNDPGFTRQYSKLEIRSMLATLGEAKKIKGQMEEESQVVPEYVNKNIQNLEKVINEIFKINKLQLQKLLNQAAELDVIRLKWESEDSTYDQSQWNKYLPKHGPAIDIVKDAIARIREDIETLKSVYEIIQKGLQAQQKVI